MNLLRTLSIGLVYLGMSTQVFAWPTPSEQEMTEFYNNPKTIVHRDGASIGAILVLATVSQDDRSYAFASNDASSITFAQTQEQFVLVGKGSVNNSSMQVPPTSFDANVTQVVGKDFPGQSTLKLTQNGAGVTVTVFLDAADKSMENGNKYHLSENYSFEAQFVVGNWKVLMDGGQVQLQASAQGVEQYKTGILSIIQDMGPKYVVLVKKELNSAYHIPADKNSIRSGVELQQAPVISGSRQGMKFQNSPFKVKAVGVNMIAG